MAKKHIPSPLSLPDVLFIIRGSIRAIYESPSNKRNAVSTNVPVKR